MASLYLSEHKTSWARVKNEIAVSSDSRRLKKKAFSSSFFYFFWRAALLFPKFRYQFEYL